MKIKLLLTTIPQNIIHLENILLNINNQNYNNFEIILSIPEEYNFRFNYKINKNEIENNLKPIKNLKLVFTPVDYGPITRLLGYLNNINNFDNETYLILLDDEEIYEDYIIEYLVKILLTNKDIDIASFYTYNYNNIIVGQCCDFLIIKESILSNFKEYFKLLDNSMLYVDDLIISFYVKLLNIKIIELKIPIKPSIYVNNKLLDRRNKLLYITDKEYNRHTIMKTTYDKLILMFNL